MIFPRSFIVALLSAPFLVLAQDGPNAFNNPETGYNVTAGQPLTLSWKPTTSGTVSLILRSGASSDLAAGQVIASNIQNSGSYTWNVPSSETRGSDYTIEIVSDSDPSQVNYTPYFVLESTNTVPMSLTSVSLGAPSTSLSLSTAPTTTSPSAFPLQSGITLSTTYNDHSSTTGSSATSSGASSASMTGSSSSMTGSHSSSMTTHASTSSNADLQATASSSTHTGSAARATAMVGMLGAVALGALAL